MVINSCHWLFTRSNSPLSYWSNCQRALKHFFTFIVWHIFRCFLNVVSSWRHWSSQRVFWRRLRNWGWVVLRLFLVCEVCYVFYNVTTDRPFLEVELQLFLFGLFSIFRFWRYLGYFGLFIYWFHPRVVLANIRWLCFISEYVLMLLSARSNEIGTEILFVFF